MSISPGRSPSSANDIGILGEDFVAQWLQAQGWTILHRRWRCRWGELDIIAQQGAEGAEGAGGAEGEISSTSLSSLSPLSSLSHLPRCTSAPMPYIVFVEVKTRSQRNWDGDGLLAIAPQKQAKLWNAANAFLAAYPEKAEYPCRFDVACVGYQRRSHKLSQNAIAFDSHSSIRANGYSLILRDYIHSAFDR